jgi:YD repeat-containing protein
MGRPLQSQVQVNGQTYSFSYAYDLTGALTSETYPSGRVIKTTYDGAERPNAVSGTLGTQ